MGRVKIGVTFLRRSGACRAAQDRFRKVFPRQVPLTRENLWKYFVAHDPESVAHDFLWLMTKLPKEFERSIRSLNRSYHPMHGACQNQIQREILARICAFAIIDGLKED